MLVPVEHPTPTLSLSSAGCGGAGSPLHGWVRTSTVARAAHTVRLVGALAPLLFLLQGIAPPLFYMMLMKQAVTERA